MVMYYHELECHEEKFICCHQGQSHSKGLYNQNMTAISSEMLILLQSNLDDGTFLYAGVSCGKKMDYCVQGQDHSETSKCR